MKDTTINGDKTVAGGGKDVTLAGRYHIIRQLGRGGLIKKHKNDIICSQKN